MQLCFYHAYNRPIYMHHADRSSMCGITAVCNTSLQISGRTIRACNTHNTLLHTGQASSLPRVVVADESQPSRFLAATSTGPPSQNSAATRALQKQLAIKTRHTLHAGARDSVLQVVPLRTGTCSRSRGRQHGHNHTYPRTSDIELLTGILAPSPTQS